MCVLLLTGGSGRLQRCEEGGPSTQPFCSVSQSTLVHPPAQVPPHKSATSKQRATIGKQLRGCSSGTFDITQRHRGSETDLHPGAGGGLFGRMCTPLLCSVSGSRPRCKALHVWSSTFQLPAKTRLHRHPCQPSCGLNKKGPGLESWLFFFGAELMTAAQSFARHEPGLLEQHV